MEKRTCHWKGCKTKIELDTSIESRQTLFTVCGFCKLHHEALKIATELDQKFCKDHKISWPIGSLSYQKYKKQFTQLRELAEHRAKEKLKYADC